YLAIALNGAPVDVSAPSGHAIENPFWEGEYMGCKLVVGHSYGSRSSSVNWYGQEIHWSICDREQHITHGFAARLEVKDGRPVNPKAPTRAGLIQDEALETLNKFVEDRIFEHVCDRKNRDRIDREW